MASLGMPVVDIKLACTRVRERRMRKRCWSTKQLCRGRLGDANHAAYDPTPSRNTVERSSDSGEPASDETSMRTEEHEAETDGEDSMKTRGEGSLRQD